MDHKFYVKIYLPLISLKELSIFWRFTSKFKKKESPHCILSA